MSPYILRPLIHFPYRIVFVQNANDFMKQEENEKKSSKEI